MSISRLIWIAGLAFATACGSTTDPEVAPWYDGKWVAISVDGIAMPATFADVRFDAIEMLLYGDVGNTVSITQTFLGARPSTIACGASVTLSGFDNVVFTYLKTDYSNCNSGWYNHKITKIGGSLATVPWYGHTVTLQRQP